MTTIGIDPATTTKGQAMYRHEWKDYYGDAGHALAAKGGCVTICLGSTTPETEIVHAFPPEQARALAAALNRAADIAEGKTEGAE